MQKIDIEIIELKKLIKFKNGLIGNFKDNPHLQEVIAEEIKTLERKLAILEERKRVGKYIPKKPVLGDDRYRNFDDKNALDILRVLYYEFFHKDPNLSFIDSLPMFSDPTLNIMAHTYLIRGEIPFKLMLTTTYEDYEAKCNSSVGIRFKRKDLLKKSAEEYLTLMAMLIKKYTNNEINFICGNAVNKVCTLSYIGEDDFYHYSGSRLRMYYEFFNCLCDNNYRNIIYIGDTMKQNSKPEEIELVQTDIVMRDIEVISEHLGMTTEELLKSNQEFADQVLTLSRKL